MRTLVFFSTNVSSELNYSFLKLDKYLEGKPSATLKLYAIFAIHKLTFCSGD